MDNTQPRTTTTAQQATFKAAGLTVVVMLPAQCQSQTATAIDEIVSRAAQRQRKSA